MHKVSTLKTKASFIIASLIVGLVINFFTVSYLDSYLAPAPIHYCKEISPQEAGVIINSEGILTSCTGFGDLTLFGLLSIFLMLVSFRFYEQLLSRKNEETNYLLAIFAGIPFWIIGLMLLWFVQNYSLFE